MYKVNKIKGYNCPDKYLLSKDDIPIMFANGKKRLSLCIQYLEGYPTEIGDKSIERVLNNIKKGEY